MSCRSVFIITVLALSSLAGEHVALAQPPANNPQREAALQRLQGATGGALIVSDHKATGAARFVRVPPGSARSLGSGPALTAAQKEQQSTAFFRNYGALVGVDDAAALRLAGSATDNLGETHLTWKQFHGAVPVFAATL